MLKSQIIYLLPMTVASEHSPVSNAAERLIASLTGVVSARVVMNQAGEPLEIHVLATPDLHPKQIARNVESALTAGLGIEIDRRIISIAQVRETDDPVAVLQASPEPGAEAATPAPPADPEPDERQETVSTPEEPQPTGTGRILFVAVDSQYVAGQNAVCRVTLRRDGVDYTGEGQAANTPQGRVTAAARAAFAALAQLGGPEDYGLEGASLVEAHGRTFVIVAARALSGRRSISLSGVAPVVRSPEEAAILASLHATNRRIELSR